MSATLGRETELASAAASLSTGVRLLTVQGPPGVGDAHLARVVAARASKGAAAELTIERQGGAQAAMARLAASLGASSDATEVLARELARRDDPVLVVLRAERDREALAERLSDLLLAARPLRVVVASQQALGAPTERVLRLGPLAPDAARALFRREARGPAEQDEAAEICALVDHLPLGIVGAARWTSLLEPGELRERLRVDLSLLAGGPPGAPAAPTLLAAIDEALDALEPDVMEALAIVASAPRGLRAHVASSPVLVAAGRAAERSLLEVEHGLLRVPSLLARRVGERDPALRARAALRLAELLLAGAPATEARAREDAELLCVGARALLACPAPRSEEAAQLLGRAVRSRGGAYREIEELARRALEDTGLTGASRAAVGIARGRAEISLGAPREAEETLRSAEALARSLGEDELVAQATLEQAYLRYLEGRMPEARARYAEAMRAAPTARQRVAAQAGLAAVEWVAGDPEEAERLLALAASAGAEGGEAQLESSLRLAFLRWDRHDLDGAEALLVEVLDATDGAGLDGRRVRALGYLGNVARERGEHDAGRTLFAEAREALQAMGDLAWLSVLEMDAGLLELDAEAFGLAAHRLASAEQLAVRAGERRVLGLVRGASALLAAREGSHSEAARLLALARADAPEDDATLEAHDEHAAWLREGARPMLPLPAPRDAHHRLALRWLRRTRERLAPSTRGYHVSSEGGALRLPDGQTVRITSRSAARILAGLAHARLHAPGRPVPHKTLVALGWPGQRLVRGAAENRLRVAIAELRRAGLGELVQTRAGAYLLDPDAEVVVT